MFEVGFTEMLLIFALALVVLGPEKLPKLAQQVGRWVGRARAMARQFREQLEDEAVFDTNTRKTSPNNSYTAPAAGAAPSAATPAEEDESSYYPPDHHAHPAHDAHADHPAASEATAPAAETQASNNHGEAATAKTPLAATAAYETQGELALGGPAADTAATPNKI
jgi:sec-independent protein translocase protein TatB